MQIPVQIRDAMVAHAYFTHPLESCGLLAADGHGKLRMVYCLTNAEASSTRYTIEPTEHFRALRHAEGNGWELVGAFHSHPHTSAYPSPTDVRMAPEPGWLYVVVGLEDFNRPEVRGFRIDNGVVSEEPLEFSRL